MRKTPKSPGEKSVKDIKRATRKQCSPEEKIRIVSDVIQDLHSPHGSRTPILCARLSEDPAPTRLSHVDEQQK